MILQKKLIIINIFLFLWIILGINFGILKNVSFGANLNINGNYRLRYEFYDNYNILNQKYKSQQSFLLSRLRVNFNLSFSKNFSFHFQLQDSEIIDSPVSDKHYKNKNNPYHDPFDINEFYLKYKVNKNLEIKLGRQHLLFGNKRIFGPGEWGNTGRYRWDALRIIYNNKITKTNFIIGRYIHHNPHIWPNKTYNGVTAIALYNKFKNTPFEFFWIYKADTSGKVKGEKKIGNSYTHFIGMRLTGKNNLWNYDIILVKELGTYAGDRISAYGLVFILGYTFLDLPLKPQLVAQYVVGSGDKNPEDGKHETFDAIFSGADTILYGWMNLCFWRNLREHRVDLILHPSKKQSLRIEYHYFTLDKDKDVWYSPGGIWRRDKTGNAGTELGHEIDFIWKKNFNKRINAFIGYSIFIPGKFIKKTGKASNLNYGFLQILFKF